jgi:hypothetical protein
MKRTIATFAVLAALGLTGCADAADTDVNVPDVDVPDVQVPSIDVPETIGPSE